MEFIKTKLMLLVAAFSVLVGCSGPSPIIEHEGKEVYTQVSMWEEGAEHITTNYGVSVLIPINTKVRIAETTGDSIMMELVDSGRLIQIENVEDYSGQGIDGIYDRYFAESPVSLSGFGAKDRNAIEDGEVMKGMTREEVLLARGYPPAHRTPSLDGELWTYWRNRFARQTVEFENGKVVELVGF